MDRFFCFILFFIGSSFLATGTSLGRDYVSTLLGTDDVSSSVASLFLFGSSGFIAGKNNTSCKN